MSSRTDSRVAIVTLCLGAEYSNYWDKYASRSWRAYADRNSYTLEVFRHPLDQSARAAARSPAWQKCLVLSQPELQQYDRVVWMDSDIVVTSDAPEIVTTVPKGKIGGVVSGDYLQHEMKARFIQRMRQKECGSDLDVDALWVNDQKSFYQMNGIICDTHDIVQTGVLVLGHEHRDVLESVYRKDYPSTIVAFEQFPLSAEIINRGLLRRIDSRFNLVFFERMLVHYPYLLVPNIREFEFLAHCAVMTEYSNAFFLHFAYNRKFAQYLDKRVYEGA